MVTMLFREKAVAVIWKERRVSLFTADNRCRVQVICPGRESSKAGCDFRDAVMLIDDVKVVGQVELHVTSDLWQTHGHHLDPAYNDVILHVAMWHKGGLPARLRSGATIPTVILSEHLPGGIYCLLHNEVNRSIGCVHTRSIAGNTEVEGLLRDAGLARFHKKAEAYQLAMRMQDPQQVLYGGIARALGYSRNSRAFDILADRLPLDFILKNAAGSITIKQAMLFGAAGLLPSQRCEKRHDSYDKLVSMLERQWNDRNGGITAMLESDWRFDGVRPENYPGRRLAGLSYLLQRYEKSGLLASFLNRVQDAVDPKESIRLENALVIHDSYYWSTRYDFGLYGKYNSALIGRGRAAEIIINVILPFFAAYARLGGVRKLETRVEDVYRSYHALPENELTRYMECELGLDKSRWITACQQQGLLHIYHSFCRARECVTCPIFRCQK